MYETFRISCPEGQKADFFGDAFDRIALRTGCRWVSKKWKFEEGLFIEEREAELPDNHVPVELEIIPPIDADD
jgi:hypothetical protein